MGQIIVTTIKGILMITLGLNKKDNGTWSHVKNNHVLSYPACIYIYTYTTYLIHIMLM